MKETTKEKVVVPESAIVVVVVVVVASAAPVSADVARVLRNKASGIGGNFKINDFHVRCGSIIERQA